MPPVYEAFHLIVDGRPGAYTVEARGPQQIQIPPQPSPLAETDAVREALAQLERGRALARDVMEQVGTELFDALFPRRVLRAYVSARPQGTGLRLTITVRPPELNDLPWEFVFDPDDGQFLAAQLTGALVRFIETGTPAAALLAPRPLRVLYVQATPLDTRPLDLEASEAAIRTALGATGEIVALRAASAADLRDTLREAPGFHVLHYDGHAEFVHASPDGGASPSGEMAPNFTAIAPAPDSGTSDGPSTAPLREHGYLALEASDGRTYPLDSELLATYLSGTSIRLVVLAACKTGVDSQQQRFSGIAHQLMRASSLPAVVANQFAIADDSAIAFNEGFYGALADSYPVDAAVTEGRKAILERFGGNADAAFTAPDWATPVLFLRANDGAIFREQLSVSEERRSPVDDIGLILQLTTEPERKHLINLEDQTANAYTGGSSLRAELRRLRSNGLIRMLPHRRIAELNDGMQFNLAEYVELTSLGQRWVKRIRELYE